MAANLSRDERCVPALREVRFREDASLSLEYETHEDAPFDDLVRALENASVAAQASRR